MKMHPEFSEDCFTLTVFSFLKSNTEKYRLTSHKRSQMLTQCCMVSLITLTLFSCFMYAINTNEYDQFAGHFPENYALYIVKVASSYALHLALYPVIQHALTIMKFSNNEIEQFVPGGSEIAFFLGFIKLAMTLFAEFLNLWMLVNQHLITHSVMHFVALEAINELQEVFFESMLQNKLVEMMHHPPKLENKEKIKFMNRSFYHKVARVIYRFWRSIYVSAIFYFLPFGMIGLQWL
jgi:hypothetical protein